MQFTFPNYYKEFSCIAGACPDTCCAGWQIVIDDKTLKNISTLKVRSVTAYITISTGKNMFSDSMIVAVHF